MTNNNARKQSAKARDLARKEARKNQIRDLRLWSRLCSYQWKQYGDSKYVTEVLAYAG